MAKQVCNSFNSKLGTARGVEQSRIWLEGKRLLAAGFKPGDRVVAVWDQKRGKLTLDRVEGDVVAWADAENRVVSGKGDKPIIDIVGAQVRDTFGCAYVEVSFYPGRIVIVGAE